MVKTLTQIAETKQEKLRTRICADKKISAFIRVNPRPENPCFLPSLKVKIPSSTGHLPLTQRDNLIQNTVNKKGYSYGERNETHLHHTRC